MYLQKLRDEKPLIHCITNIVVANFQANGLLALGASPVMADAVEEAADMAAVSSAVVLNIGTLKAVSVEAMCLAGERAAANGIPVILDPVGAGATSFRKAAVLSILEKVPVSLIRCNAGELAAIAGIDWQAKGVDAGDGEADLEQLALEVATRYSCLVAVTGVEDLVTDGKKVVRIAGGHSLMTRVTGVGCLLSAVVAAFVAVADDHKLEAAENALAIYKRAGEQAAALSTGPGDFAVNLLNALYAITEEDLL
ncbi:hydroxyethylthiazole kinase [Sporosarcina sp. OR05]|uniref:hydroxyethylthiazole kinase n=1 Tax=Sporosarcina sp. OR05 TaxID=2969819 RepID=UPI00352BB52F